MAQAADVKGGIGVLLGLGRVLACALLAACGDDSSADFGSSPAAGPGLEPPGTPGGDTSIPGDTMGPGLEPPGQTPTGVAGGGADVRTDGGVNVDDGAEQLPRPDDGRSAFGPSGGPPAPADEGSALRDPPLDGGVPDGWDEFFADDDAGVP